MTTDRAAPRNSWRRKHKQKTLKWSDEKVFLLNNAECTGANSRPSKILTSVATPWWALYIWNLNVYLHVCSENVAAVQNRLKLLNGCHDYSWQSCSSSTQLTSPNTACCVTCTKACVASILRNSTWHLAAIWQKQKGLYSNSKIGFLQCTQTLCGLLSYSVFREITLSFLENAYSFQVWLAAPYCLRAVDAHQGGAAICFQA